ncbi:hypothetical protein L915_17045 [Phytophthora nicotianae]|uniref:Integrase catalytic domain-containing protein n=1 Tax=Phytophthora nicotianae TaxID=4792 RepID=W2G2N7_PHYNI|nr:hypothetical protein L915_17045 [Phytophthora nicotianae]
MSTASQPETDGQTERANRVVEDVLRSFATSFTSWSSFLPMVEFAINNAVHASTGLTPFFINFDRRPSAPWDGAPVHRSCSRKRRRGSVRAVRPGNLIACGRASDTATQGVRIRATTKPALNPDGATQGQVPRTNAATGATPPDIAAWTSRTLIAPSQCRAVEYQNAPGAVASAVPIPANFDPLPVPQPHDAVTVNDFLAKRESIVRFVRYTIATAVDRQKEYADRCGRKNREVFVVDDRVLLSTAGIQPTAVTNLGTSKLAPRFIGPFKVTKVLGDAYTLQLPTAIRLQPTFYVGRPRRYHPADVPSGSPDHVHGAPVHVPPTVDAAPPGRAPAAPSPGGVDAPPPLPPSGRTVGFLRDGPPPLVDTAGHVRHIVKVILSTTIVALLLVVRSLAVALVSAAIAFPRIGSTLSAGSVHWRIVGSPARCSSKTFRTAWRRTRQAC